MDQHLEINVGDATVYGKLRGSLDQPLVIIIHGLPCNMDEFFYKSAAIWFSQQGLASFRFNLYDWRPGARQLIDSTLTTHAHDLDGIVEYFRSKGVEKIYVAGHSYGGPTILLSRKQDFDAAVLWDPSYKISFIREKYGVPGGTYLKEIKGYFMKWGVNVVIGEAMANETEELPWDTLMETFKVPIKIVAAGNGVLVKGAEHYFQAATSPKDLAIIEGATHYFDDTQGMQEHVFTISKEWFQKY